MRQKGKRGPVCFQTQFHPETELDRDVWRSPLWLWHGWPQPQPQLGLLGALASGFSNISRAEISVFH